VHHPTYVKNEERSTNVIVSNHSGDKILFSTFYADLFLLSGKKVRGGHGPPDPSPCYGTASRKLNLTGEKS